MKRLAICVMGSLMFALAGCDDMRSPAELPAAEQVLSQYQTIHIGSQKLTLPTMLLLSSVRHSSMTLHDGTPVPVADVLSQRTHGTQVADMSITLDGYRSLPDHDLDTSAHVSPAFCDRLRARWEQSQCSLGLYDGKTVFVPQRVNVVERSHLVNSSIQLFVMGGQGPSGGDAARQLLAQSPAKPLHCTPQQAPLCTAVLPIGPDVVVVWATTPGDFESGSARVRWLMTQYLGS